MNHYVTLDVDGKPARIQTIKHPSELTDDDRDRLRNMVRDMRAIWASPKCAHCGHARHWHTGGPCRCLFEFIAQWDGKSAATDSDRCGCAIYEPATKREDTPE